MKINIISVSKKPAAWITEGVNEYIKRLSSDITIRLIDITPARRQKSANANIYKIKEADNILAAIPKHNIVIALDETGRQHNTVKLSENLSLWTEQKQDLVFIIGGADGLASVVLERANEVWSLSNYTLPHAFARILLLEQLYRAWSILNNHPYHRE